MIGQQLGSYRVLEKIGEGGMGAVYLAEHTTLGRRAAIKVLLPERASNSQLIERFFHEAKTTAMLQHPNLVDIYDYGHPSGGLAYIVMEYLVGESLAARLRRERPLPLAMIYVLGRQIAMALQLTHTRGIMHRDLKPENLYLVTDTDAPFGCRIKVVDFGLAKLHGDAGAHSMTQTGALLGTPLYMSPEQCRGVKDIDVRTDIYSLGCILYEMAVGEPPFIREAIGDLIIAHIQESPVPPRQLAPHVAPELEALILRCLAKRPADRVQSMGEIASILDRLLAATSNVASLPLRHSAPALPMGPATTTTIGASNGQVANAGGPSKRSFLIAGAGLLVGGVAAIVVATSLGSDPAPSAGAPASNVATAPPVELAAKPVPPEPLPVPTPVPTPPPDVTPPPAKAMVKLELATTPPGAQVLRKRDHEVLGTTPFALEVERGSDKLAVVVKRTGFVTETVTLDPARPAPLQLKLKPKPVVKQSGGTGDGAYDPFAPKKGK